jgi:prepilin peptidase dependent protein D
MDSDASATRGFTLIELMITVTIVAILAAVALPSYIGYTRRSYYKEIVAFSSNYKLGVTECFQSLGTTTACSGGSNFVPPDVTTPIGTVASIVTSGGIITITPTDAHGITAADTLILTPTNVNNVLQWVATGGGVDNGYAQ